MALQVGSFIGLSLSEDDDEEEMMKALVMAFRGATFENYVTWQPYLGLPLCTTLLHYQEELPGALEELGLHVELSPWPPTEKVGMN